MMGFQTLSACYLSVRGGLKMWRGWHASLVCAVPRSIRVGVYACLSAIAAFGQVSVVRSGSLEVGPFLGASYGIDKFRVMAGGNVTYALKNKYVLPYFEYSYFPGLPRQTSGTIPNGGGPYVHTFSVPLSDIHGGVHVRLPVFRESPFVPYLVFGMGVVHYPARIDNFTFPVFGEPVTVQVPVPGGSDFTINGGGGLRYYIGGTGRIGLRAEAKIYKPTSGAFSNTTIGKLEVGFFFQVR
jgi:hypothetical protein